MVVSVVLLEEEDASWAILFLPGGLLTAIRSEFRLPGLWPGIG
jgi:hypothetical protein